MRIPYRVKQTILNSRYSMWDQVNKKNLSVSGKIAVFDMRNLIPDRRTVQVFMQLRYAGYTACLYIPSYYYWLKAAFLHNWRYSEVLFDNAPVVQKLPEIFDIVISKKGSKPIGRKTIFIDDRIMDDIVSIRDNRFFYPILFHPSKLNAAIEAKCAGYNLQDRKVGMLFVGNTGGGYSKHESVLHEKYKIHSRTEVIDHLKKHYGDYVYEPESYKEMMMMADCGALKSKIVIVEKFRAEGDQYCELLGMTRFHLHTAGVIIPYCHNQIESAACGCVPITEFACYFPQLIDSENCLSYDSLNELGEVCKQLCDEAVCNSDYAVQLSKNAREWYNKHWSFCSFKNKLEQFLNSGEETNSYYIFKEITPTLDKIEKMTGFSF